MIDRNDISPFSLTMGQLVRELEIFADLYEACQTDAERDVYAASAYRRLELMDGIHNIREYSRDAFGGELTIRTANLMIDELVREYGYDRTKAEGLWLMQAALELSTIPAPKAS